jgi:hypothetical protein
MQEQKDYLSTNNGQKEHVRYNEKETNLGVILAKEHLTRLGYF